VGENRCDEAEGGGDAAFRCGHDFMQGTAGEAAAGQVGIDCRQAKGQGFAQFSRPGQQAAQLCHHGGAVARRGKGRGLGHGATPILGENHGIFTVCSYLQILEQNRNNAKAELRATGILLSDQWLEP
jgi:hypothetical protein